MGAMREAAELQTTYQRLINEKRVTKQAICDLCIPFRDKYRLNDFQTLRIAGKEMDLSEILDLLERLLKNG